MKKNPPLIFFDFETGGLNKKDSENSSNEYPITEAAFIGVDSSDYSIIFEYSNLIKPYDESLVYSTEAAEKTGITKELCEKNGINMSDFVKDLNYMFTNTVEHYGDKRSNKPILVGHNVQFDIDFLQKIIYQNKKQSLLSLIDSKPDSFNNLYPNFFDTLKLAKQFFRDDEDKTSFSLINCCKYLNVPVDNTHRALDDVRITLEVYRAMMNQFKSNVILTDKKNAGTVDKKRYRFQY